MSGRGPVFMVRIARLAAGGDGVGRAPDGRVVFVPFTAPGDLVEVEVEATGKRFLRARARRLREPGPARTDPLCAVFGSCGGCAWQHVAYPAQVEAKRAILREAVARIGGLVPPDEIPLMPSPSPYGYRARTRVVVEGGRVGYRRRRSRALCATARCPILVPALDAALAALAAAPPAKDGEWELAAGEGGAVRSVALDAPAEPRLAVVAGGERVERGPGVFAQSNALLLDALVQAVVRAAGAGASGLELFAGAGFFTLPLGRRLSPLVAVEGDARAAADLARNLGAAGLASVEVRAEPVEQALTEFVAAGRRFDVAVLDPPRTGLPAGVLEPLLALRTPRVVYLSCDPATLARDLSALARERLRLVSLEGFDLFPQTPHVEALAVLERAPGAGGS